MSTVDPGSVAGIGQGFNPAPRLARRPA